MLKSIMTMGVPSTYKTQIVTTEEARKILSEEGNCNRLIIVKTPDKLLEIKEQISKVEFVMLGNIAKRGDSIHKVSGATGIFYLSEKDVEIIDSLSSEGIEIFFQQLPGTTKTSWSSFKKSINK